MSSSELQLLLHVQSTMLTSGNQYLRPEYLTPLPTTLDAKKSPLALLAQTCSQIGADLPNSKLIQSAEKANKNNKSESSKSKSPINVNSNDSTVKSSFKPYDSCVSREKTQSPEERNSSSRVRTPIGSKGTVVNNGRCNSNQSETSSGSSPATSERKTPAVEVTDVQSDRTTPTKRNEGCGSPMTPSSSTGKASVTPSILTSTTDPSIKDMPLGTFKPGAGSGIPPTSTFLGGYPTPGIPLPMDLMASSLLSHHQALKSGAFGPYSSYARMKSSLGSDALAPACRDPYCTGCSLSSHLLTTSGVSGKSSCPAGCTQCDHVASKTAAYLGHNPVAAAYAHAQLAALAAASQLPYVCNWIAGDATYCGKRFSSSEELLQHLRSHTAMVSAAETNPTLSMLNSTSLPPTHPLFHRTYPTPPLSPLATARYHPYSKPSLLPPSLSSSTLSSFPLGHPGLPAYLSPYTLYGPRLSTTSGMHP